VNPVCLKDIALGLVAKIQRLQRQRQQQQDSNGSAQPPRENEISHDVVDYSKRSASTSMTGRISSNIFVYYLEDGNAAALRRAS
jgi:hypothetical protein